MTDIQEGQRQTGSTGTHFEGKKKSRKLARFVGSVAIFFVIVYVAKFLGGQAGRQAAMQTVEQECISQNASTGFMGAKWLMSLSEVKSLFPDAIELSPEKLRFETTAFSRPSVVTFIFDKNCLKMIIITFKGDKTESTYRQTHNLVVQEYGAFPEPTSTSEQKLISNKTIGGIEIVHLLYEQLGMPIEQVMLYRTKDGS